MKTDFLSSHMCRVKCALGSALMIAAVFVTSAQSAEQQRVLDSLYSVWEDEAQPDSSRINAFQKYIWDGFIFSDTDSAYVLTEEFEAFAERKDNDLARLNVLNLYGCYHFVKGDYDQALKFFEEKLAYDEKLGLKAAKARTYGNIGLVYQFRGDLPGALRQFKLSYTMKKEARSGGCRYCGSEEIPV